MGKSKTKGSSPGRLDPHGPAIEGFRAVLADLAKDIEANWQGTVDRLDPEFLHQLRVAVRRSRSVISHGAAVLPQSVRREARTAFRSLSELTGRPRDLDVYILGWDSYTEPLGTDVNHHLAPVRELLEADLDEAYAALIEWMRSPEASDQLKKWQTWLKEPLNAGPLPRRAQEPLGPIVADRIISAQDTVLGAGRLITDESPEEALHDLRKDAKKLRYLLECFGSVLEPKPRTKLVKRLKALQENLGEHQDASVHLDELRSVAGLLHDGSTADTMLSIGQLMGELVQVQRMTRNEFAERFAAYDTPATAKALAAALRPARS